MSNFRLPCCIAVSLLTRAKSDLEHQMDQAIEFKRRAQKVPFSISSAMLLIAEMHKQYVAGDMRGFCKTSTENAEKELEDLFGKIQELVDRLDFPQNSVNDANIKLIKHFAESTKLWTDALCHSDEDFFCPANKKIEKSKDDAQRTRMKKVSDPKKSGITVYLSSTAQCSNENEKTKICKDVYLDAISNRFGVGKKEIRQVKVIEQLLKSAPHPHRIP